MLYQNDELYKLAPKEIELVEKHFHGKFPVKVTYPPERIVPSKLKHNRLPDKPNSISFDYKATVKTKQGVEIWRYAENIIVDERGVKKYVPKKFLYFGARFLERNDIELIYFLLRKSEYCKGGDNEGPMVKFMFEDLVTEAEKKAVRQEIEAKIGLLLYNKDYGLPEVKIRAVAKAYQMTGIDDLTLSQVKVLLNDRIHSSKEGPDEFFRMVEEDDEIKVRMSITKAMEMGILKYDDKRKNWFWQAAGEKGTTPICKTPPTKTPNEALYDYYLGNAEFRDDLRAATLTNDPKAGNKKEKEEPVVVEK